MSNLTNFTLKRRFETRQESCVECRELLIYQIVKIDIALTKIGGTNNFDYEVS